jgi:hypothetical protein
MDYFYFILGGFSIYVLIELWSLKKKVTVNSKFLANIDLNSLIVIAKLIEGLEPNDLTAITKLIESFKNLKPYEWRVIISQYDLRMASIEQQLKQVDERALQAINNVGSIIRHSKQHPIDSNTIKKFISDQGLLNDESP